MALPSLRTSGRVRELLGLVLLLGLGLGLRLHELHRRPLWVDEAESSINALTILEEGVPRSEYLGLPIYENTLLKPWPEHPEYEFQDLSYSDKGVAVYHGWLPLYAMAGSFWLAGIGPDRIQVEPRVQHSLAEMLRRTRVARLPAVFFGTAFLLVLYLGGRTMGGRAAGWSALLLGALSQSMIDKSQQARYYSATFLVSALCCLLMYRMLKEGRWRDVLLGGVAFGLLFHTHVLTFLVACLTLLLFLRQALGHERALAKGAVFLGVVLLLTLPWALWSGFLETAGGVPYAWTLLSFPEDQLAFLLERWPFTLLFALGLALPWLPERLWRSETARRVRRYLQARSLAFRLLWSWLVVGFLAFTFLVPAASYFPSRMTMPLTAAGMLLTALLLALLAHLVWPRRPVAASLVLVLLFLGVAGKLPGIAGESRFANGPAVWAFLPAVEYLESRRLAAESRVYALPNDHLTLTFYTGIPVQSVAPVRRDFLERYPGEVVIFESVVRHEPPERDEILARAREAGVRMGEREAGEWQMRWLRHHTVRSLEGQGVSVPASEPLPPFLAALRPRPADALSWRRYYESPPAIRGFPMPDYSYWWQIFFYRFAEPERRMGEHLNYATRTRVCPARVLPSSWVVYHCPAGAREGEATRLAVDSPGRSTP